MSTAERSTGWWAEYDEEQTNDQYRWRPVLQLDGWMVTCDGPWFATEDECLAFIKTDILGQGLLD